jgi:hypothetical protein
VRSIHALPSLAVAAGVLLFAPGRSGADGSPLKLRAYFDPPALELGQVGRLVVEVAGPGLQGPSVSPRFELRNVELVGPASHGQQVVFGTGGSQWQHSWSWPVRGLALGPAEARGVRLVGTDPPVTAEPARLEIVAAVPREARPRRSPTLDEVEKLLGRSYPDPFFDRHQRRESVPLPRILVRTVIDETRPFVGQRVLLTTWVYTQARVRNLDKVGVPDFEGLWAENLDVHPVEEQESVEWQGEVWRRAPIDRRVLHPLKPGPIVIGPTRVRVLSQNIERDPIFYRPVLVPVDLIVASEPVALEVRPLPAPPADLAVPFSGAVGRVQLVAELVSNRVEAGHGASLTVRATGPASLAGVEAPTFAATPGLRITAAPAASPEEKERGRSWSFVLVPEAAGERALPPVEMAYFDPDLERYEIARAELPSLHVRPAAPTPAVSSEPRPVVRAPLSVARLLPWALGGPAAIGVVLLVLRRRRGPRSGPVLSAAATAEFAAALERARGEERPRRAAREIEEAWRSLLATAPDGSLASCPAEWPADLARRGASTALVSELERLVGDLAYLRHAPELAATSALIAELASRSLRLARAFNGRFAVPTGVG